MNRVRFWWRYFRNQMPWDTGLTPPEIIALANELSPGRALDLGCGTGTTSLYLARRGWQVTGIDFIPAAIRRARQNAKTANLSVDFQVGDVTRLEFLAAPYDLAVDIGCFHSLLPAQQNTYANTLCRLTRPGAVYALYAFAPRELGGRLVGVTSNDITRLFTPLFKIERVVQGSDTSGGATSAWYWLRRA